MNGQSESRLRLLLTALVQSLGGMLVLVLGVLQYTLYLGMRTLLRPWGLTPLFAIGISALAFGDGFGAEELGARINSMGLAETLGTSFGRACIAVGSVIAVYWTHKLMDSAFNAGKGLRNVKKEAHTSYRCWRKHPLRSRCGQLAQSWKEFNESEEISKLLGFMPMPLREVQHPSVIKCVFLFLGTCGFAFLLFSTVWGYQAVVSPPPPPPPPTVSAEPIVAFPVLFGKAQVDDSTEVISEDLDGVRLENSHEMQLRAWMNLVTKLAGSGPNLELRVVGYASHTPIFLEGRCDGYDCNVIVANLRAKAVEDYLNEELKARKGAGEADLTNLVIRSGAWTQYHDLKRCRPYKSPIGLPENHGFAPLERLNQSVMLYVINGEESAECIPPIAQ